MTTRILIVDDDALARQLYADTLGEAGHEVVPVRDAAEAALALDSGAFDVVVTDLVLPGPDGIAVLTEAKRRDPGIEVILITAVDRVDPAVRAMKSGAADYLVKPVSPESLQLSVSRCIATRQLLKENALLRQHLSLVETGQRLATTLDRERLFPMALRALVDALGAHKAALFARRADGRMALMAQSGLSDSEAGALADEALPPLAKADGRAGSLEACGRSWRLLYAEESTQIHGVCLLADPTSLAMAWSNAQFLARHLAIALQNIRRLSEVEDLIYLDDLTRLHNLRYLHLVLDREITNSKQTAAPFSVLFLDLDHFKTVNDTHGHLAGSKLLV